MPTDGRLLLLQPTRATSPPQATSSANAIDMMMTTTMFDDNCDVDDAGEDDGKDDDDGDDDDDDCDAACEILLRCESVRVCVWRMTAQDRTESSARRHLATFRVKTHELWARRPRPHEQKRARDGPTCVGHLWHRRPHDNWTTGRTRLQASSASHSPILSRISGPSLCLSELHHSCNLIRAHCCSILL